jgi:hypothetical protein
MAIDETLNEIVQGTLSVAAISVYWLWNRAPKNTHEKAVQILDVVGYVGCPGDVVMRSIG